MSRQFDEKQEELADEKLAHYLGISIGELNQLDWELDTNESKDGLIYNYIIEFHEDSPKEILDKISDLEDGRWIYLPPQFFYEDLYEDHFELELNWEINSTEQLTTFRSHLESVNKLINLDLDKDTQFSLLVMLHAHIVSATESFLSSTFISEVTNSDVLIRKLIESDPEFGKRKLTLKEIYERHENLKITVASYLKDLIFHRLPKIKLMYLTVLEIDFEDISWLITAIEVRHDCVHRAGFNKEGERVEITKESIKELAKNCDALCEKIAQKLLSQKT